METQPCIHLPGEYLLTEPPTLPLSLAVDEALLTCGLQAAHVCLPLTPQSVDEARSAPGALMLGAACVLTADMQDAPTAQALTSLAEALRFHPDNFRRSRPMRGRASLGEIEGILVRDGTAQRAYFAAAPSQLAPLCDQVWDGQPRAFHQAEKAQLLQEKGTLAFATAAFCDGQMQAAVYLGSVALAPAPNLPITNAVARLQSEGTSVAVLHAGEMPLPGMLTVSCAPLPGARLIPPAVDAPGLDAAVHAALAHARQMLLLQQKRKRREMLSFGSAAAAMVAAIGLMHLTQAAPPWLAAAQILLACILTVLAGKSIHQRRACPHWAALVLLALAWAAGCMQLSVAAATFTLLAGILCGMVLLCGMALSS